MPTTLTKEQQKKVSKLKGLSRVLADFADIIENDENPEATIEEAAKVIEYYQKNYFKTS